MSEETLLDAFFDACRRGALAIPRCDSCGTRRWPPRPVCAVCGSFAASMQEIEACGSVFSWTTIHRPSTPLFAARVPYVVGVIELDAATGIRMLGGVDGIPPEQMSIGTPVVADFREVESGVVLPWWQPR